MSNKMEELKKINAEKKALAEKQKALREELDATKEQRKAQRTAKSEARKQAREIKGNLRDLTATVLPTFKKGSVEEVEQLADNIMEVASELAGTIRKFAEASKDPEVESDEEAGDDL